MTISPVTSLLIGASMWGVIWYPMRLLETQGLSGIWLTLVLFAAALVVSLPRTHKAITELVRSPGHAALLMLAAGWTNIAFVEAVLERQYPACLAAVLSLAAVGGDIGLADPARAPVARGGREPVHRHGRGVDHALGRAHGFPLAEQPAGLVCAVLRFRLRVLECHHPQGAAPLSLSAKVLSVWGGVVVLGVAIILSSRIAMPAISLQTFLAAAGLGVVGILLMTALVQHGVTHMPVHRSAVISLIELVAGRSVAAASYRRDRDGEGVGGWGADRD